MILKFSLGNVVVNGAVRCGKKLGKNRFEELNDFIWREAEFEMPAHHLK